VTDGFPNTMVSISLEEVGEITKGFSDGGEDEEEICGD